MPNNFDKLSGEYASKVSNKAKIYFLIRLIPGMETIAQNLSTGVRLFEQDLNHIDQASGTYSFSPGSIPTATPAAYSPTASPTGSPIFPVTRQRVMPWLTDGLQSYPTLLIEEGKVAFYSDVQQFAQFKHTNTNKILLNVNHIVSFQMIKVNEAFTQNQQFTDIMAGKNGEIPKTPENEMEVNVPETLPVPARHKEFMVPIKVFGGVPPYTFTIHGAPSDLYITKDGWIRGVLEDEAWPEPGKFIDCKIMVFVTDSSVPNQMAGIEYRFRLETPEIPEGGGGGPE